MDADAADARIRAAIEEHWRASEAGETEAEHAIYADDAFLDYPQSGERFRGRATIAAQRGGHPADRHFTVLRISGGGPLWVSECIITYDGAPTYSVSIMEFTADHVTHESQYFADPFGSPPGEPPWPNPSPAEKSPEPSSAPPRQTAHLPRVELRLPSGRISTRQRFAPVRVELGLSGGLNSTRVVLACFEVF